MLASRAEYDWMAQAEGSLWWYRSLHTLVADALAIHPSGTAIRVLDAGCGTGGLMQFLARRGFHHIEGIDVSPWAIQACQARGLKARLDDLQNLHRHTNSWDAIVSNDTLSFFAPSDQARIVQSLADRLTANGLLILNLPALTSFRGRHDAAVGTIRRSSRRDLQRLLDAAGLQTLQLRFWPFVLSPAILAVRVVDRIAAGLGYRGARAESRLPPRWLNDCLRQMVNWELRHLSCPPFGSSIFGVARKCSPRVKPTPASSTDAH